MDYNFEYYLESFKDKGYNIEWNSTNEALITKDGNKFHISMDKNSKFIIEQINQNVSVLPALI
jgi:hypothetical protein